MARIKFILALVILFKAKQRKFTLAD